MCNILDILVAYAHDDKVVVCSLVFGQLGLGHSVRCFAKFNLCCQVLVGEWYGINRVMQCYSSSLIPGKIIVEELCHFYLKQMRAMSRQVMSYYEKLTKKRCNYRNLVHREERWIFFIRFDTVKVWKLFTQVLFLTSSNRRTCKPSARWSHLDLAKCMFCASSIWLFALSIIIDNYKECYCCRNGQSSIRVLLCETNPD